jgi:replicative DNA helicase
MTEDILSQINKPLPCNEEGEKTILSLLIQLGTKQRLETLQKLKPLWLYRPHHRTLLQAITTLAMDGEDVNMLTLTDRLRKKAVLDEIGGPSIVSEVFTYVMVGPDGDGMVEYTLDSLRQAFQQREIIRVAAQAIKTAQTLTLRDGKETTPPQVISSLSASLLEMGRERDSDGITPKEAARELLDRIENPNEAGCRSQFPWVNEMFGGYVNGTLNIIGGQRGSGKSALALQEAVHIARQGDYVTYYNLEMVAREQTKRGMLQDGLSPAIFKNTRAGFTKENQEILSLWLNENQLFKFYDDKYTIEDIIMQIRIDKLRHNLKLVVIDLFQKMRTTEKGRTREEEFAICGSGLKRIAKEVDIPIIVLSHLNDQLQAKYCTNLENDADTMFIIAAPKGKEDQDLPDRILKPMKKRDGTPEGNCAFRFIGQQFRFEEIGRTNIDVRPVQKNYQN